MKRQLQGDKRAWSNLAAIGIAVVCTGLLAVTLILRNSHTTVHLVPMGQWGFFVRTGDGPSSVTLTKRVGPLEFRSVHPR
jgi:hypothetical protein